MAAIIVNDNYLLASVKDLTKFIKEKINIDEFKTYSKSKSVTKIRNIFIESYTK